MKKIFLFSLLLGALGSTCHAGSIDQKTKNLVIALVVQSEPKDEGFSSIIKEILGPGAKSCGVDENALASGVLWPGGLQELKRTYREAVDGADAFKKELAAAGLELSVECAPELKGCALGEQALRYNPGGVEALRYVRKALQMRSSLATRIADRILVRIVAKSEKDLYDSNKNLKPVLLDGKRTLVIHANAGDYQTGLAIGGIFVALYKI